MENQMEWKDEYNIGVKIIDEEHQRLFKLINRLFALGQEERKSARACREGIKYFKAHAVKHFEDEENYMELIGYEDLETHRRVHRDFREDTLPALERELERSDYSQEAVVHFLAVCAGWLIGHTLTEDRAIVGGKIGKWEDLLPEKEVEAFRQVISRLLHDMFRLKAQVISEAYDGEKFGKGIYYRVVYGREQDRGKWEIFLVFEEKLLINTVGNIMGIRSGRLDAMLMNACRYTASQFVWRVMRHFPALSSYEMQEANFLTYDQFQEAFEKKKPQVSLLLDTSGGYFAYCVIAPHQYQHSIGTPLEVDNEMSEIEKYLTGRDATHKPRVLVVDDSMTVRQGMKNLLAEDCEMSAVSSGVAAIRAITLDPPDLILLDYEMPICDGVLVLEMLYSEDEFAHIPVVFLTSRDDPDTVRRILALKPAGYLLKYLKPAELKKRIREYLRL